jgi:tRNA threonylcarbamoyladenosine biosynthesis protein TsaE
LLGVEEAVNSPTFSLINEYRTASGELIVHADWYRVRTAEELFDAGMLEYLDSGVLCLIEWPAVVPEIWEHYPHIAIEIEHLQGRPGRTYRVIG